MLSDVCASVEFTLLKLRQRLTPAFLSGLFCGKAAFDVYVQAVFMWHCLMRIPVIIDEGQGVEGCPEVDLKMAGSAAVLAGQQRHRQTPTRMLMSAVCVQPALILRENEALSPARDTTGGGSVLDFIWTKA